MKFKIFRCVQTLQAPLVSHTTQRVDACPCCRFRLRGVGFFRAASTSPRRTTTSTHSPRPCICWLEPPSVVLPTAVACVSAASRCVLLCVALRVCFWRVRRACRLRRAGYRKLPIRKCDSHCHSCSLCHRTWILWRRLGVHHLTLQMQEEAGPLFFDLF